jgi:hypothetical protein
MYFRYTDTVPYVRLILLFTVITLPVVSGYWIIGDGNGECVVLFFLYFLGMELWIYECRHSTDTHQNHISLVFFLGEFRVPQSTN